MTGAPAVWCPPASYLQEQLYRSVDSRTSNYNVLIAWRLRGPLDAGALRRALSELAGRHEVLRTSLGERDGAVEQRVHRDVRLPLRQIDVRAARDPEDHARRLVLDDVARPFALSEPPLWRAVLARLDEHVHVLALVLHHAVCDGWSSTVLERDLVGLHRAVATGDRVALPELPVQFGDVAAWERSVRDPDLEQRWRDRLHPLPTGWAPPSVMRDDPPFDLVHHPIPPVPAPLVHRLAEIARAHGATLPTALHAAALLATAPVLGEEVVVGLAHANRADAEVQPVVGPVFDYLPLRVDLRGAPGLGDLTARLRQEEREARARMLPLVLVERAVLGDRAGSGPALFDLVLNFIPGPRSAGPAPASGPVRFERFAVDDDGGRVPVDRDFYGAGRLSVVFRHDPSGAVGGHLYGHGGASGRAGLASLGHRFRALVEQLAGDPAAAPPAGGAAPQHQNAASRSA